MTGKKFKALLEHESICSYAQSFKNLTQLLDKLSIPYKTVEQSPKWSWDGKKINIVRNMYTDEEFSNACHELAHYLMASPKRMLLKEYGLGQSPDALSEAKRTLNASAARKEEEEASVLGVLIEYHLGQSIGFTFTYHSWDDGDCTRDLGIQLRAIGRALPFCCKGLRCRSLTKLKGKP